MSLSIYSPQVIAYAREHSVTELQAYRALKSRDELRKRKGLKFPAIGDWFPQLQG